MQVKEFGVVIHQSPGRDNWKIRDQSSNTWPSSDWINLNGKRDMQLCRKQLSNIPILVLEMRTHTWYFLFKITLLYFWVTWFTTFFLLIFLIWYPSSLWRSSICVEITLLYFWVTWFNTFFLLIFLIWYPGSPWRSGICFMDMNTEPIKF